MGRGELVRQGLDDQGPDRGTRILIIGQDSGVRLNRRKNLGVRESALDSPTSSLAYADSGIMTKAGFIGLPSRPLPWAQPRSRARPPYRHCAFREDGSNAGVGPASVGKPFSLSEARETLEMLDGLDAASHTQPSRQPVSTERAHSPDAMRAAVRAGAASSEVRSYSEMYRRTHALRVGVDEPAPGGPDDDNISSAQPSTSRPEHADTSSVASALARAQQVSYPYHCICDMITHDETTFVHWYQALDKAESSLDSIDSLPSARRDPPWQDQLPQLLAVTKSIAIVTSLSAILLASHAFGLIVQWTSAFCGGLAVAVWGYRKKSLSSSGAIAAAVIGTATLGCSLRFGATLLAFYFSSSKLTQYKEELKDLDDQAKKGGQRDWVQVCQL